MLIRTSKYLLILSLILFIISLTQLAVVYPADGQIKSHSGLAMFIWGPIAFFGSGAFETFVWLANPLYFIAIFLTRTNKRIAANFSIAALAIAISFAIRGRIITAESGSTGVITHFGTGYWL
jgi:hypothetical protein